MSGFMGAFKEEIRRLARKEVKESFDPLRKQVTAQRSQIASLRRELAELHRELKSVSKSSAKASASNGAAEEAGRPLRFSAAGFASHRERLGLSAADMGKLLGVTGQSVYAWEQERSRPRRKQLEQIAEVRSLGKREAIKRLESLG